MSKPRTFDADAKTKELQDGTVTIGGRAYHPALLTPDVRREQIEIRVKTAKLLNANGMGEADRDKPDTDEHLDQRVETIAQVDDGLYEQLAVLLRDEDDDRPELEVLRELDQRVARDLLNWLEEDSSAGEEKTTPTPAAT